MKIELTNKEVDTLLKALSSLSDYMQMSYSNQEKFRKEHNKISRISNKIFRQSCYNIMIKNIKKEEDL